MGIKPILNTVSFNNHQVLKLTISLVLFGVLSSCEFIPLAATAIAVVPTPSSEPGTPQPNHFKPEVLTSNEDMIVIKYRSVGPNVEHERALQLISDHCNDSYIETSRKELSGWITIEADCSHGDDS